ncbi:MAG: hypothetical protein ACRBB0_27230 [Pelagimonas sp.]|uniref:hypothetical protein n=1 Tax=Pelagimonas sp. TaxID=2073170 RepID=UPI003D6C3F25
MIEFDLEAVENAVLAVPVKEQAAFEASERASHETDLGEKHLTDIPSEEYEIISLEAFNSQFIAMHDMAGGLVQMRTSAPCPLGDQARSEGGRIAAAAAYELFKGNPATKKMFLSTKASIWGQVAAIGMHGFGCLQVIKASRAEGASTPVFSSVRAESEEVDHDQD